jgi:acyl carrier protein
MPDTEKLVETIIRVIVNRLNPDLDPKTLSAKTCLIGKGLGLDSIAVLSLVTGLEEELSILIDESELKLEMFADIESLAGFLSHRLQ